MSNKKKVKKTVINKDQLGLVLGVLAIVIIVGFLFFINKNTSEEAIAGKAVFDLENQELTVSCNAESLEKVKTYSTDNGCSITSQ